MIDDFANRAWAEHHKALHRNVSDVAHAVGAVFDRLHAHLFDAPWKTDERNAAPRCG